MFYFILKKTTLIFMILMSLTSCSKDDLSLDKMNIKLFKYKDIYPSSTKIENLKQITNEWNIYSEALVKFDCQTMAELVYVLPNDSVEIDIIEFSTAEMAYGFLLHTDLINSKTNWRFGMSEVKHYYADKYVFRIKAFQPSSFNREIVQNFLTLFSNYPGRVPEIFDSFPRKNRIKDERSLQIEGFMGSKSIGVIVSQAYEDSVGRYVLARTLGEVNSDAFNAFTSEFKVFDNIKTDKIDGVLLSNTNDMFFCAWNKQKLSFIYGTFDKSQLISLAEGLQVLDFLAK